MFFLSKRVRIHTHAHVHPHMPIKTQWYISGFPLITWHILPNSFRRREKEREDVPFFTLSIRSRWRGRRNESVTFTIHVSAISSLQSLLETCPLASFFFVLRVFSIRAEYKPCRSESWVPPNNQENKNRWRLPESIHTVLKGVLLITTHFQWLILLKEAIARLLTIFARMSRTL